MKEKIVSICAEMKTGIDRLYPSRYRAATTLVLIVVSLVLSTLFVFSLPAPLRPKTSVGLINVFAIVGIASVLFTRGWRAALFIRQAWDPFSYAVALYFFFVLLSLLLAPTIYDTTPLRLLAAGVFSHWLVKELMPTERQKAIFVHVLGATAVVVAVLSLMQALLPTLMNAIAERYLLGRSAYGITIEFNRGRLLHWGALIFVFPFFYSSTLMLSWRSRIWSALYVLLGYVSILGAMAMANFRWMFIVFIGGSTLYFVHALRTRLISGRRLKMLLLIFFLSMATGLVIARVILGYNLLDRFLLRDAHRDIRETTGRITLYSQALTAFQAYPLFGAGYGNYYAVVWPFPHMQYFSIFDQFDPLPVPIASHNEFYTVLAETGVFGLIFFLLILYLPAKHIVSCLKSRKISSLDRIFLLAAAVSWLSLFLYIWFENIYPQNIVYVLVLGGILINWFHPAKPHGHNNA